MTKGKKFVIAIAVLAAVALVSGLTTLAVTSYGSRDDPLVTLSYLNETLTPSIRARLDEALTAKADELTRSLDALISGSASAGSGSQPSGYAVLTLSKDQVVTCEVGAEIMLRIGSAVSSGADTPRLVDETSGSAVNGSNSSLTANHLYMVTIAGNGIKATKDNTRVLIRGTYTVS